jgi:hypothetical protein
VTTIDRLDSMPPAAESRVIGLLPDLTRSISTMTVRWRSGCRLQSGPSSRRQTEQSEKAEPGRRSDYGAVLRVARGGGRPGLPHDLRPAGR